MLPQEKGDSFQRLGIVANSGSKILGFPTQIYISCHSIFLNSGISFKNPENSFGTPNPEPWTPQMSPESPSVCLKNDGRFHEKRSSGGAIHRPAMEDPLPSPGKNEHISHQSDILSPFNHQLKSCAQLLGKIGVFLWCRKLVPTRGGYMKLYLTKNSSQQVIKSPKHGAQTSGVP